MTKVRRSSRSGIDFLAGGVEGGDLEGEKFLNSFLGEIEHLIELGAAIGFAFGGGLGLDQTAGGNHDHVHVDGGAGVLLVGEIEQDVAVDDADRGRGDHLQQGRGLEGASGHQLIEGKREGDRGAGDGGGAGAAVGLQHIAVDDDGALAEGLHVDDGAEGAADEALDLVGAAAHLAALALAGRCG